MHTKLQFGKKLDEVGEDIDRLREKAGVEYKEKVNELRAQKDNLKARWRLIKNESEETWEKVEKTFTAGLDEIEDLYDAVKKKISTTTKTHA